MGHIFDNSSCPQGQNIKQRQSNCLNMRRRLKWKTPPYRTSQFPGQLAHFSNYQKSPISTAKLGQPEAVWLISSNVGSHAKRRRKPSSSCKAPAVVLFCNDSPITHSPQCEAWNNFWVSENRISCPVVYQSHFLPWLQLKMCDPCSGSL